MWPRLGSNLQLAATGWPINEKVLNSISHQGNANENYSKTLLSQVNGYRKYGIHREKTVLFAATCMELGDSTLSEISQAERYRTACSLTCGSEGRVCNSAVDCLPGMCQALGLNPSIGPQHQPPNPKKAQSKLYGGQPEWRTVIIRGG